jgi:hypothetical protein
MGKRSSAPARVLAVTALVGAVAVILVVVATSFDAGGDSDGHGQRNRVERGEKKGKGEFRGAYVVQNGDTLSSIAHETGVPVSQIIKLNPGVDPQILISGEKLKLR